MKLFEELKWRGLIKDISSPELEDKLNNETLTFYWGTDPTADSLHLGHYSSLVTAKRLAKAGHHPILLVGGATGLIGDPRPTAEREIIQKETVEKNLEGIRNQVSRLFEGKAEIVNNYDWTKDVSFLDFLRDVGKYINVNYMLDKDIIRRRLTTGITFAEFAYTLIQGNDFLHLYQEKNCVLQVEGSDQGRGNSGVLFSAERYEVQILDTYNNSTYADGYAGALYGQYPPSVNPIHKPGEWNNYDIIYIAPRFNEDGSLKSPARVTVLFNGVLVQWDRKLTGSTVTNEPYKQHDLRLPISLQDHGNPVRFRNIWIREIN